MWQKEPARWTLLLFDCFVPAKVWNKPKPEPSFESSRYFTGLFEEVEWNRPVFQWSTVSQLAGKTKQLLISLQHPQFHSLPLQSKDQFLLLPLVWFSPHQWQHCWLFSWLVLLEIVFHCGIWLSWSIISAQPAWSWFPHHRSPTGSCSSGQHHGFQSAELHHGSQSSD